MLVLGIDPAPSKQSIVFDGKKFRCFTPYNLKRFIDKVTYRYEDIFIAWDAPLSGGTQKSEFNLYERKIEKFFNRLYKKNRTFDIPKGISTLGFASCSHWTISQYVFGYPCMNYEVSTNHKYKLINHQNDINYKSTKQLTEIHPALSMWIILKDKVDEAILGDSWVYKGSDDKNKTIFKRRSYLVDCLFNLEFISSMNFSDDIKEQVIQNDDKLDAFVCFIVVKLLMEKNSLAKIYGDKINGSFLLFYDKFIENDMERYFKL